MRHLQVLGVLAAWSIAVSAQTPAVPSSTQVPSTSANAGKLKRGGMCSYAVRKNVEQAAADPQQWIYNRAVFTCDHLGDVTVAQVYEKGWRVVGVARHQSPQANVGIAFAPSLLIIEEQ